MVLRPPPPTGFSDIEPLGSMTLYIKLRTIIGKSTKLPSQHIAITKYCHHGILPLLTFAIPTFCHSNILQLQHYSISERKKSILQLQILYYQDILPSKTLYYQTCSALTKYHQDILQHFVVVMVIVMLVLVLYYHGFSLVPSY